MYRVGECLIFGTMMIGQSLAFAPNYNKAKISGARVLQLLDRRPKIENSPGVGLQIVRTLLLDEHETMKDVSFRNFIRIIFAL